MKKLIIIYVLFFLNLGNALGEIKIKTISEGNIDAKVKIIVYESLTCSHCANFHKNIYPELKKQYIDTGIAIIEFKKCCDQKEAIE